MSEEYDTECLECCGYQDHIEQLEQKLERAHAALEVCDVPVKRQRKRIEQLEALTEADGKEIGSYRKGTGLRGENRAMMDRIEQLGAVVDAALDEDYRRHLMSDLKQRLQAASEDHLLADGMLYRMALARIEQLEAALENKDDN